jgi:hypothetical protein
MTKSHKAARPAKSGGGHISRRKAQKLALREVTEFDPNGIQDHRTVDTLRLMLDSGAITPAMHAAARDFQAAFTIACFDCMPRLDLRLMARSPHDVRDLTDTQIAARERVAHALDALGGHGSPAGSCVWHVVGMQASIREWALRQGWGGEATTLAFCRTQTQRVRIKAIVMVSVSKPGKLLFAACEYCYGGLFGR